MMIGSLKDVQFGMDDSKAMIISSMTWGGSVRYATHQVHNSNAVTEFTGNDPDTISIDIILTKEMGVDPMQEMTTLWGYMRDGETLPFTLGDHAYGRYRWTILSLSNELTYFDRDGNVLWATVSVSLQEYLKDW